VGTGSFLGFSHPHKVFGRLDIELLGHLVTDDHLLLATSPAHAFLRLAGNELLNPRQLDRQALPRRPLFGPFERQLQLSAFALGLDFRLANPWFLLQQFELFVTEPLTSWPLLLHPHQTQQFP
jgi:hypothetical protein